MKKILIPCICFISILSLTGCANTGDSQTITSLNNQLSRVDSIVRSTSTNEIADVSPYVTLESNEPYNSIQSLRALSNENMIREEELRQNILNLNSQLKSCTNKKYKLGKRKNSALNDITSNLSKYVTHLNGTKPQVKSSVSKIKRNLKVSSINIEAATSAYTTLNSSMNERYAYLRNIYSNLEQACIILDCDYSCENCKNNEPNNRLNSTLDNTTYIKENTLDKPITQDNQEEKGNLKIVKNIDSYTNNNSSSENNLNETLNNTEIDSPIKTQPYKQNNPYPITPMQNPYHHKNAHYNHYLDGYYGYNHIGNRFNPNRNTDTFYSFNRNIDTYRFSPNYYNYNFNY